MIGADGTQIAPNKGVWTPFAGTDAVPALSYLHEREHKRELRPESAKEGTRIAASEHEDLKRNLEYTLRAAFVRTLQARAVLDLARADLDYYDKIIAISRSRFRADDIAQIDLDRIELLRVQYEVEIQAAIVNLRTAKIQLLQLLNNRMAYVAVSRGAYDAQIFTNDREKLGAALGHDVSHSSAHAPEMKPEQKQEKAITPQRDITPQQEQSLDIGLGL